MLQCGRSKGDSAVAVSIAAKSDSLTIRYKFNYNIHIVKMCSNTMYEMG